MKILIVGLIVASSSLFGLSSLAADAATALQPKLHSCVARSSKGGMTFGRYLGQGYRQRDAARRAMAKCHRHGLSASSCRIAYCTTAKVSSYFANDDSENLDLDYSHPGRSMPR